MSRLDDLMAEAARQEMPAIAMTDHGTLYGAYDFYKAAKAAGVKPIIGLEGYYAPQGRFEVTVKDGLPLLDAIAAAGGASNNALADAYADALLQQGQNPDEDGVPMVIAIKDRAIVLEAAGGDITLGMIAP